MRISIPLDLSSRSFIPLPRFIRSCILGRKPSLPYKVPFLDFLFFLFLSLHQKRSRSAQCSRRKNSFNTLLLHVPLVVRAHSIIYYGESNILPIGFLLFHSCFPVCQHNIACAHLLHILSVDVLSRGASLVPANHTALKFTFLFC
jgi:hypothetical protein